MVSPPTKNWPLGRIIIGHGSRLQCGLKDFFEAQRVQKPIVIDTSWLDVGHSDELVSFVPAKGTHGWKVLIASPLLACIIIAGAKSGNDDFLTIQKKLEKRFLAAAPGKEYSPPYPWDGDLTTIEIANSYGDTKEGEVEKLQKRIDMYCRYPVMAGLGLQPSDFIDLPVWFAYGVPVTPDSTNMLILSNGGQKLCVLADPAPEGGLVNPQKKSPSDLDDHSGRLKGYMEWRLKEDASGIKSKEVKFLFQDPVELHLNKGEFHCGSNQIPTQSAVEMEYKWWEKKPAKDPAKPEFDKPYRSKVPEKAKARYTFQFKLSVQEGEFTKEDTKETYTVKRAAREKWPLVVTLESDSETADADAKVGKKELAGFATARTKQLNAFQIISGTPVLDKWRKSVKWATNNVLEKKPTGNVVSLVKKEEPAPAPVEDEAEEEPKSACRSSGCDCSGFKPGDGAKRFTCQECGHATFDHR